MENGAKLSENSVEKLQAQKRHAAPYERVYHFKRRWIVLIILVLAVVLTLLAVFWAPRHLFDPTYHPQWEDFRTRRCRKGSCLIGLALYIFLLLPIWIKASLAGMLASEAIARSLIYGLFAFDKRPDFAIGPDGVYGLCGLRYYHVSWKDVSSVYRHVNKTRLGSFASLVFKTTKPGRPGLFGLLRAKPITFTLVPAHGFDIEVIRHLVREHCPAVLAPDIVQHR